MKRNALFLTIAIMMLLATACGSSAPAATEAPAQPAVTEDMPAMTEAPTQPAATAVPTEAVATNAPATAGNVQVDIILVDNSIESSLTTFQVGVPYTFVITNAGRHTHNFNINTPVAVVGSIENAFASALLIVKNDDLEAGESVTVEYTFPDTAADTQLEFSCLIRRHYEDGMLLPITVTK